LRDGNYIPEGERRELSRRFRQLIDRLDTEELRSATHDILEMIDYIRFLINEVAKETERKVVDTNDLKQLWLEAKAILAEFAGNKNLDDLENQIWEFFTMLRDDPETNDFFHELREYITTSLDQPTKLKDDEWRNRGEMLFNWGRGLMQSDRYNTRFQFILQEMKDTVNRISRDPLLREVTEDIQKLSHDILLDKQGRPSFMKLKNATQEIRTWVIPILRKELELIAIPRIEGTTPKYQYWVDNVSISGKEIIPEKIKLDFETTTEINVSQVAPEDVTARLTIEVKDITNHFRDVRFWVNRTVMPKYEDTGVIDVDVDNMCFYLKWKLTSKAEGPWKFDVDQVKITIGNFKVNFKDVKHNVLDKVIMKLFNRNIRKTIESGAENYLREKLTTMNEQLERIANNGKEVKSTP
jgi:ribosome-associated toxin RatA of RatAB toxin-antitoxin module